MDNIFIIYCCSKYNNIFLFYFCSGYGKINNICDFFKEIFTLALYKALGYLILILCLIFFIISLILFIIDCSKFNGDDTRKYSIFLDCTNVNKTGFSKYSSIEDLKSHIIFFKIFNSIFIVYYTVFIFTFICSLNSGEE